MPGSGNKGDRGDGTSGGFGGGGFGGGGLGGGGVGRDTISAYGGNWARMGNFRGDPNLGGGGAVSFSGITSLAQAQAAAAANPVAARQSGLSDAIASGRFGPPTGMQRAINRGDLPAPATQVAPPAMYAPPPAPPMTATPPTTLRPQPGWGIPGLPPAPAAPGYQTSGFWGQPTKWARNPDAWRDNTMVNPGYGPRQGWSNLGDRDAEMGSGYGLTGGYSGVSPKGDFQGVTGGMSGGSTGPGGPRNGRSRGGLL